MSSRHGAMTPEKNPDLRAAPVNETKSFIFRYSGEGRTKAQGALNVRRAARRVSEANHPEIQRLDPGFRRGDDVFISFR